MYCTQCALRLPVDAAFCPSCGAPVRRSPAATLSGTPISPGSTETASSATPAPTAKKYLRCPRCGLFAPATALHCDCGYRFVSNAGESPSRMPGQSSGSRKSQQAFARLEGPARWTKWLLIGTAALCGIGIVSGLMQVDLLSRAAQGITDAEAAANDSRQQAIGTLQVLLLISTAVAFLIWFYRAHSNLPVVSSIKLVYTPGWAVGGFFVPFLNLVRPVQVMRELWHGTMSAGPNTNAGTLASTQPIDSTPVLVGWWWGLFLVSNVLGNQVMRRAFRENPTLPDLQVLSWLQVLSDGLDIPTAVLAILLVDRITKRQLEALNAIDSEPLAERIGGHV